MIDGRRHPTSISATPSLDDELAVQQVVYTLQAAAGERLPVQLCGDGRRSERATAAQNDVLSLVSISDPAEGSRSDDAPRAHAAGRTRSRRPLPGRSATRTDTVVERGSTTAEGADDRLYPWEARIDVSDLPLGFYTFVAMTDDPTGGAEGNGPDTDTRTIIVR